MIAYKEWRGKDGACKKFRWARLVFKHEERL